MFGLEYPYIEVFASVRAIANENSLPHFLVIWLWPFFVRYICKYKASKYSNVAKILGFVYLGLLRYEFPMSSASCRELIWKRVSSFYCFSSDIIRKPTVNEYYVLHYDNSFLSLFGKPILFVYIWSRIFNHDLTLFTKSAKFDKNKFFSIVCS